MIGQHQGLMYHTLGQRKGLHIGGTKGGGGNEEPWFVGEKDLKRNVLIAVQGKDHPLLKSEGLIASQLHWVNRTPITEVMTCTVKHVTVKQIFLVQSSQLMMRTLRLFLMTCKSL